jgi:hypothetical protein
MKFCPQCAFSNDERFPTCVYCNTLIVDVPPIPSEGSERPRAEQEARAERRKVHGRQFRNAAACYVGAITFTAVCPGFVFDPLALLLFLTSSLVVVGALRFGIAGQIGVSLLQGAMSLALLIGFGPMQPFIFFMLLGHIAVPALFWWWTELIDGAHR